MSTYIPVNKNNQMSRLIHLMSINDDISDNFFYLIRFVVMTWHNKFKMR